MWNNNQQYQAPPPQGQGWNQPQGGWGAPPPQQGYGAPPPPPQQQGWGAPPPQQGYGAPPPPQQQYGAGGGYGGAGGYGQPQGQQGYGVPPQGQGQGQYGYNAPPPPGGQYGAPNQYGAPPPGQGGYGAPPAPQQQQWGAPPPPMAGGGGYGGQAYFLGVPVPPDPPMGPAGGMQGYNAQFDAERVRKATKGFGTDEKVLIDTLSPLDAFQLDQLNRTYEQSVGRTLQKTLEKELSSWRVSSSPLQTSPPSHQPWLEYTLVLLSLGPLQGDVYLLHRACKGAGTHEDLLNEILLGRTNMEINMLKQAYQRKHGKDLAAVVRGELSMKTERMFNMALAAGRDESTFVDQQAVQNDVHTLQRAGPGKIGTDEIAICGILLQRSDAHLRAVAQSYQQQHRKQLSDMIKAEFSGHMRDGLYHIARGVEADGNGVQRDVEALEAAMAGAGTKDERMIYRIVRAHWNRPRFGAIKNQFQATYRTTLRRRVEGETTGKYEKALVAIIEQM